MYMGMGVNFKIEEAPHKIGGEHPYVSHGYRSALHIWSFVLLVWVLTLVFLSEFQFIYVAEDQENSVTPPLRVAVYYEALCPDSRDFVVRQLLPAYKAMNDVITVDLVPYGKAKSYISSNGRKTFDCQHGPKECKANMVHACVSKYVKNEDTRLHVIQCMIEINFREEPFEAGRKCLLKYNENIKEVEKCSSGTEGEELHFHMGKMTHDLEPEVSFIPTITINDNSDNQPLILKNFLKQLCDVYSGPKHSSCVT